MSGATASASTSPAATCSRPRARRSGPGRSANPSTIPRPAARCSRPRRSAIPAKGKIWLSVNGTERQNGDLTELIWSVPEIIWQLSQQVSLAAGDIIMTGTPAGVAALSPGDKIECGVDGVGTLKVTHREAGVAPLRAPDAVQRASASRRGALQSRGRTEHRRS